MRKHRTTLLAIALVLGFLAAPIAFAQGPPGPLHPPMTAPPLTPMAYPSGPPPVTSPATAAPTAPKAPDQPSPTAAPTSEEFPDPDETPTPTPSQAASPREAPVTQTEAIHMLRFLTGKDLRVNTLTGETALALRGFQKSKGLEENGRLDDLTLAALAQGVQEALKSLGYEPPYRAALRAFQGDRGLTPDGDFGKKTSILLKNALAVRHYQELLQTRFSYGGALNGKVGDPDFRTALEKFQRQQGLPATGKLDPATRKALSGTKTSPSPAATRPATPISPAWHWLGGFVLGVVVTLGILTWMSRRPPGR